MNNIEEFPDELGAFVDKAYERTIRFGQEIAAHNRRVMEKIRTQEGQEFYAELMQCIDNLDGCGDWAHQIVDKPKGEYCDKAQFMPQIRGYWTYTVHNDAEFSVGIISVKLSDNQYIQMVFMF